MSFKTLLATSAFLAARLVSGHSVITNAVGDAGGQGTALGVVSSTPRDGTRRNPFQQDATRFRGQTAKTVGETVGAGPNDIESGTQAIMAESGGQLPQVTPGGNVQMTLHQVNADGAGPYTCMINSDGTAQSWQNIQVSQNVAGNQRGRNRGGNASDHPLTAAIPANQQCTGQVAGQNNVCLVRCQNPARAGPFGGVVPVQMAQGAGNNGNAGNGNANNGNANNGNANNDNANNGNAKNGNANNANANNDNANNGNANNGNANNANANNGNANNDNTGNDNTGNGNANNGNANNGNANNDNTGNDNTGNGNANNDNTGKTGNGNAGNGNANNGNANNGNAGNTGNANTGNGDKAGNRGGNNNAANNKRQVKAVVQRDDNTRAIEFTA